MAVHTIRPGFTISLNNIIYSGGEEVELDSTEFELHKHKLEGVPSTIILIDNLPSNNNGDAFPSPFVAGISGKILTGKTQQVKVSGSFFTPDMSLDIESGTIELVEFVSDNLIEVAITATAKAGKYDLILDNGTQTVAEDLVEYFDIPAGLVDLRLDGTEFSSNAIEMDVGTKVFRTDKGMYFDGANNYSNWVRFVGDNNAWVWDRSTKKTLTWIFTNSDRIFIGIGSFENNESNNSQFYQFERSAFMQSTYLSSTYGNNGNPGSGRTQSFSPTWAKKPTDILKLVFTNNGDAGGQLRLYKLPSAEIADWFNNDQLLGTLELTNLGANANPIMPAVVPRYGDENYLLGFILEDE